MIDPSANTGGAYSRDYSDTVSDEFILILIYEVYFCQLKKIENAKSKFLQPTITGLLNDSANNTKVNIFFIVFNYFIWVAVTIV